MIYIDFIGGAHGNFLEVVCNLAAGVETTHLPFNSQGASHNKRYIGDHVFESGHYTLYRQPIDSKKIISIKISHDDLLPLSQISFLRAGDFGYDNNSLEFDTFNKLNNSVYQWVLGNLLQSFFHNQIKHSYESIKDSSWPEVNNYQDFENLPNWIKHECSVLHKLELLELSAERPHCPRHVLREFFQIGFEQPDAHGFMQHQANMKYPDADVYWFSYSKFYTSEFMQEIKNVADWAGLCYNTQHQVKSLHEKFLQHQPYKDSKQNCDIFVQEIINGKQPPAVNLLEEAYINAELKKRGHECRY